MKKRIISSLLAFVLACTSSIVVGAKHINDEPLTYTPEETVVVPMYNDTHSVYTLEDTWIVVCSDRPLMGEIIYVSIDSVDQYCTADHFEFKVITTLGGEQDPVRVTPYANPKKVGTINALVGINRWQLAVRAVDGEGFITVTVHDTTGA